ncbi:MAG: leucine-rich repeat domain-containing protein [Eubacteriales bacterium]|nr:leucine-rich repeat domain-containing protein [Eubacteriales bacterium]
MLVKKLKRLLLVTLSCIMISVPVSAAAMTDIQFTAENDNDYQHLEISASRVYRDYPIGEYKKVTLLPSVTQVESDCFANKLYVEEIRWMASVDSVPSFAFSMCPKLRKVTISNNVKKIGASAFSFNSALASVVLPNNLQSIGQFAFAHCENLKTLYVPETVTQIDFEAFKNCDSLTVHGKKNSYAYYYCKMNGIPFVSEGTASKPATDRPYIKSVSCKLVNKQVYSTIALNGKIKNADGYQYQIYNGVKVFLSKNSTETSYTFKKVPCDLLFARVRSYNVQNGKKIYSKWSNDMRLVFPTIKLDNIKLIRATGGTKKVTAQFSKLKYSDGFDCVLKNSDSGEKIILKNQKRNTVTFKNVEPGIYYLSAHAYTKINGIKQFGIWSESKKVVVK